MGNYYLCLFMRKTLSLLFIVGSFFASGQETDNIQLIANWKVGLKHSFSVEKTKQQWENGNLATADTVNYTAFFEVLDAESDFYRIRWSFRHRLFNNFNMPAEIFRKIQSEADLDVIYTAERNGAFIEVENWEEIGTTIIDSTRSRIEVLATSTEAKDEMNRLMAPVLEMFATQHGVEELVLNELQYFHFPFGASFSKTEPLIYEQGIPTMISDRPILAQTVVAIENVDETESEFTITNTMKLDPDSTRASVEQFVLQLTSDQDVAVEAIQNSTMEVSDDHKLTYNYKTALPTSIQAKRTTLTRISGVSSKRVDETKIKSELE